MKCDNRPKEGEGACHSDWEEQVRNSEEVDLNGQTGEYRRGERMKKEGKSGGWGLQIIKCLIVGGQKKVSDIDGLCLHQVSIYHGRQRVSTSL